MNEKINTLDNLINNLDKLINNRPNIVIMASDSSIDELSEREKNLAKSILEIKSLFKEIKSSL